MKIVENIKKITLGVLGTAILASGLWACSDDLLSEDQNINNYSLNSINVENKSLVNPLEHIGVEHNLFMEKFTVHLEESYQKDEWTNIDFLSNEYRYKLSDIINKSYHTSYEGSTSTISAQIDIYNQLNLNEWYDGNEITQLDLAKDVLERKATAKDKEFALNLLNDIFKTTSDITDDELVYLELEKVILKHENLILSESWGESEEYALGALAVAKYSLIFWKDYDFNKFSSFKAKGKNPRGAIVVGADSAGFIVGGGVGAASGSFLGPAGTVGGWFGGCAAGAWGASSAAATAIAIYDYVMN